MDNDVQNEKLKFFFKSGIVVLTLLVVVWLGAKLIPKAITVANSASSKKLPIYCVDIDENKISLSFDVVWGNEDTAMILSILEKYNIKVTFFLTGAWVERYPEDVKAIAAAGHDLGNHSATHKHMSQLSKDDSRDEIIKVHNKVKELTGIEMNLFRPPYGDYNNRLIEVVNEMDYHCIQWDVDSYDWKDYGVEDIIRRCTENNNLKNGSIILMHNGAKYTPEALEKVIIGLMDKGYELVPISQLIHRGGYTIDNMGIQHKK